MSSPSSLLLPENGEDWPIRMVVLVTPWAWPAPTANTHASAPTAAVHVRIIVIALSPRYGENRPLKYRRSCVFWRLPPVPGRTRVRSAAGHVIELTRIIWPLCGNATRPADSRSSTLSTDWVCCQAGPARCPLYTGIIASNALLQLDDS